MTFCNAEFGCDCEDEIRELKAEVEMLRLRLQVNTSLAVGLMDKLSGEGFFAVTGDPEYQIRPGDLD